MITIFLKYVLYLHIAAGGFALIAGLIPMIAKKGNKLHKQAGTWYFWAMFIVFITALLRFKPEMKLIFLACIAIFSFYNTFTGRRLVQMKSHTPPQAIDWIAAYLALAFAIFMLSLAIWGISHNNLFITIVLGLFGLICLRLSYSDIQLFRGKIEPEKMHWLLNHIARMVGSYIATVTAFIVVNNHGFVPDVVGWVAPTIIGAIGIIRWRAYYRAKFNQRNNPDVAVA